MRITNKSYTEYEGCPKCDSSNINFEEEEISDGAKVLVFLQCDDCHCTWTEVYTFSHSEVDEDE